MGQQVEHMVTIASPPLVLRPGEVGPPPFCQALACLSSSTTVHTNSKVVLFAPRGDPVRFQ